MLKFQAIHKVAMTLTRHVALESMPLSVQAQLVHLFLQLASMNFDSESVKRNSYQKCALLVDDLAIMHYHNISSCMLHRRQPRYVSRKCDMILNIPHGSWSYWEACRC